jgi:hypothetical protein
MIRAGPESKGTVMKARAALLVVGATIALPAHATMAILATPVPGLGLAGVAVTGVVALVIAWWRMRK